MYMHTDTDTHTHTVLEYVCMHTQKLQLKFLITAYKLHCLILNMYKLPMKYLLSTLGAMEKEHGKTE